MVDEKDFDYSTIVFEKQKVLIVDDEQSTRDITKGYLEGTSLQVIEAEDGQESLQILEEHKPDLILMDLAMPGMNGVEATRKIRKDKKLKGIPILAFTASKTYQDDVKKYRELFERYLFKPISKAKLFFELTSFLKIKMMTEEKKEFEHIENFEKIELSSENKKMLPEIVDKLNGYLELWESTCKSNNFNKFKNFGLKIKEFGDKFSIQVLSDYGDKIVNTSGIKKIKAILNIYPDLISKLSLNVKEDIYEKK